MPDSTTAAFLEACGSNGPLRLSLKELRAPRAECRLFDQPFLVVGRAPGADLALDHPAVSRRHAYVQLVEGRLFGVDLSSRTGTYWQDEVRSMGWLVRGQSLRIGPYRVGRWSEPYRPGDDEDEPPSPASRSFEPPGLVEGALEFLDPSVEHPTWPINQVLVLLGRSPSCKIQLSGSNVSKLHGSLVRTARGIWVVDLLGRGGIKVNGVPARSLLLDDGDVIQIGPHRIRLRYAAKPDPPPRPALVPVWPEAAPAPATIEPAQILALREAPADALLVPLVRELGQMQQQMADQFQHALMMMFQMFSGMHQEQMALVREQLAELNRLGQEQQGLQAALARPPARERSAPPAPYRRDGERPAPTNHHRPAPPQRPPEPPEPGQDAIHAALVDRLAAIQQERESRWQRLIRSVTGG